MLAILIDTAELEAAFLARYGKFPSTYEKSRI
jgi:hypothetical protein